MLFCGLRWGLPSRAADPYLFGNEPVWSGQKILALGGGWDADAERGADVARNPLSHRDQSILLNGSDVLRARIIRRYRLFSYQPDEMITFRALASMDPHRAHFDPKLYQYGGLWIYPVGVLLKAAAALHLVALRSDLAWYVDHPEDFGGFYVIARCYSALWGLAGVAAVYALVRRISACRLAPAAAGLIFAMMPVVVTAAHEAKPHLPGAVLILLAVLAAASYVERGTRAAWLAAGMLCGAAVGMVLWAYPVFLILPAMVLLRPADVRRRAEILLASGLVGLGVYALTNPYLPINLLFHREVLRSNFSNNLGNTSVMYHVTARGTPLGNAAWLVAAGMSPLLALAGVVALVALGLRAVRVRRRTEPAEVRRRATGLLLAVPAVVMAIPFVSFAAGKTGEYGRFAIVPDIFLAIEAVVAAATLLRPRPAAIATLSLLLVSTAFSGSIYLRGFLRDSVPITSRMIIAERLRQLNGSGYQTLAVFAEPAPYCQPPVDLFRWRMLLMPRGSSTVEPGTVIVRPLDPPPSSNVRWSAVVSTPLSWADKQFEVRTVDR